jgi:hypothetical protein
LIQVQQQLLAAHLRGATVVAQPQTAQLPTLTPNCSTTTTTSNLSTTTNTATTATLTFKFAAVTIADANSFASYTPTFPTTSLNNSTDS